jgi:hypothetical protein
MLIPIEGDAQKEMYASTGVARSNAQEIFP